MSHNETPCLPVGIPGLIQTGTSVSAFRAGKYPEIFYRLYVGNKWVYSTTNHDDVYRLVRTQPAHHEQP